MHPPELPVYQTDLFIPQYRAIATGRWRLKIAPLCLSRGYWSGAALIHNMTALLRDGISWMSTSPTELESQEIGIRLARGHVLIFGLGMGWSAVNCALRPEVDAVTVVELDADVLALHRQLDIADQLPEAARGKLRFLQGDAFDYVPDRPVDVLMPDIWLPMVSDGRVAEVQRMQRNVRAQDIYFWGQELELARHAVAAGRRLDDSGIAVTAREMELPLFGPGLAEYAETVSRVAANHMKDRWLTDARPD
jgi:hypothetical protein